jgi:lysophospholipase L1-like esterase
MDFTINTHNHLRSPPIPPRKDRFRILAIGDSCTFGLGVNDDQSWPSQLDQLLAHNGYDADVINAGVPGYTSFQGKRFLETKGLSLSPDLIVACFGFNDQDCWASRSDRETARDLALRRWQPALAHSQVYRSLRRVLPHAPLREQTDVRRRPRLSQPEFYATIHGIKRLCDQRRIRLVLVVWPAESQITNRRAGFFGYHGITAYLCDHEDVPLVNLADAFFNAEKPVYLDHIHANPDGCRLAASAVLAAIEPLLHASGAAKMRHGVAYDG